MIEFPFKRPQFVSMTCTNGKTVKQKQYLT